MVPGAYSVTETNPLEWELTNLVCSGTSGSTGVQAGSTANINLTPGGSVSCTFTNTKAGHIIIDKVTDPSGDPQSFVFDPCSAANFSLTDATPKDSGELKFGVYSVVETVPAGWDLTSATCSDGSPVSAISLQPGETVTCTFTNTKRGHIIVEKVTSPAGIRTVRLHAVVERLARLPADGRPPHRRTRRRSRVRTRRRRRPSPAGT